MGGTKIETWAKPGPETDTNAKHAPGSNYLKHIEPLVGTLMAGALWYQGEANANDGYAYFNNLKTLIATIVDKLYILTVSNQ